MSGPQAEISAAETRPHRPGVLATLAAAVALCAGCSWTLMDPVSPGAPPSPEDEPPACTESEGWAIWDTALGTSTILVGGLQLAVAHETRRPALTRGLGLANLVVGGVYVASALVGYHRAEGCARARDAYWDTP